MSRKIPRITPEEIQTIKDAQAGSMKAFNRIFHRYKGFVDNVLFSYTKDMDEAKDLTNVVFMKVYDKLSKFNRYESFGGWLRILAKNTAIDYLRTIKDKGHVSVDDDVKQLQLVDVNGDDEISMTNKATYDHLIELIHTMPPSYRETCRLFYVENLKVKEIAEILNIPVNTIKSYLFRMRKRIKKLKL
jgi:RNA polymerase sigma-70 factor (ECF subfamily)